MYDSVLVLDFGSQYTQLIARRVRELGVYSEIKPCFITPPSRTDQRPQAIILSGGPASVLMAEAPRFDPVWLELGVPVLGICYGMQLIAYLLGGKLDSGSTREYGAALLEILDNQELFHGFETGEKICVWMSHGDHVSSLPPDFFVLACSSDLPIAAMGNAQRRIYGVQFHPEVVHTQRGSEVLRNFLFRIADCKPNWNAADFIEASTRQIAAQVPAGSNVVCGLSGGVDSAVAACLVHRAIGKRLHCIFVDNGLLRKDEVREVERELGFKGLGLNLKVVDAADRFLEKLKGVTAPEEKRKIIGRVFIEVFENEALAIPNTTHLVQGTLYPDVIESVSVRGPSVVIKSHHNVGGLPAAMKLALIEPLRELFKDEVRRIGRDLGIPEQIIARQPFPGPGLAVRIVGEVTPEKLELVREADLIFNEEIDAAGLRRQLWQSFVVLLPVSSVGVMGDARTYEQTAVLRAVSSQDGMTANWSYLPEALLRRVSSRIINEVQGINRVVYDISSKPPATIEWE